jgi:hypothetical protein
MQPIQEFLQHNLVGLLLLAFMFAFAWVIVSFGWRYYRHKKTGLVFPQATPESVKFEEWAASGCSNKTAFTRMGGARNCRHVTSLTRRFGFARSSPSASWRTYSIWSTGSPGSPSRASSRCHRFQAALCASTIGTNRDTIIA